MNHEHGGREQDVEQIEDSEVVIVPQADIEVGNGGTPGEIRDESAQVRYSIVHCNNGRYHQNATEDVKKQGDGFTVGIILSREQKVRVGERGGDQTSDARVQMASETPKVRKKTKKPATN